MAEAVSEILLRITGDADSARRELQAVARQVQQFDGEDAEATVDVDSDPAERKLKDVFGDLAKLAKEKVTAMVDADATEARAEIERVAAMEATAEIEVEADTDPAERKVRGLIARLAAIRDEEVEVDVDTDAAERALVRLRAFADRGRGGFRNLAQGIRDTGTVLIGVLIPGIISLMGTLLPLVATLGGAALGLGALGTALAGSLIPVMVLAAATMERFARTSKFVGTAANDLKRAFQDFAAVARRAFAPAAGQVLEGLTGALRTITPLARELGPVFERLGRAVRESIGLMATQLVRAAPMLERLTRLSQNAIRPLTRIFANLARVVLNLAVAALPFLVDGLKLAADETRRWVRATADVDRMRGLIRGFLRDLRDVGEFAREAGRLLLALFNVFRGPGRDAANDLTQIVSETADWVESARGQREIRQFFEGAFFAIRDLADFVRTYGPAIGAFFVTFGKLATELMQVLNRVSPEVTKTIGALAGLAVFGKALASVFTGVLLPVFRPLLGLLTGLAQRVVFAQGTFAGLLGALGRFVPIVGAVMFAFTVLSQVMGRVRAALTILSPAISGFVFVIQGWVAAINAVLPALRSLGGAVVEGLSDALSGAVGVARAVVTGVIDAIRARVNAALAAGRAVMGAVRDGLASVADAIRALVNTVGRAVIQIVRSYVDNARAAGTAVFQAVRNGIASVAGAVRETARSILSAVVSIVRGFADNARAAGAAVFNAVRNGIASLAGEVRDAARSILARAIEIVRSFVDNARAAGESIVKNVANGFIHAAGEVISAARNVVNRALSALRDLASAFYNAGKSLVSSLASGIRDAAGDALGALGDLAGGLRRKLPFSEPKDPTSPLRGLGDAGRAFVQNFAAGIAQAGPQLSSVVANALAGMSAAVTAQVTAGSVAPVVNIPALSQPITRQGDTYNIPVATSGYGPESDARELVSSVATLLRLRGGA